MRYYKFVLIFCILLFVSLCLLHYFSRRPLWLDENFILTNIKNHKTAEILGPLNDSQAFPRIYLIAINKFAARFNYDVLALRLFPLVSMLIAFFLWLKIYHKEALDRWQTLLCSFSIACSYSFSYYASEVKQYSMDVLVVGIFCLYFGYQKKLIDREPSKIFILATLLLPFTLLLSYSGFFVFWIVSYNFLFVLNKGAKIFYTAAIYTLLCFLCIVFVYYFDIRHTLSTQALFSYWNDYFISIGSFPCLIKSFGEGVRKLTAGWFGNSKIFVRLGSVLIPFFALSLFVRGIKSLKRNKFMIWEIDSLGLVIFLELFMLGILKKYPFTGGRLTLFFAPLVFYFIIKGINYLRPNRLLYFGFSGYYVIFLIICMANSFIAYLNLYRVQSGLY